MGTVDLGPESMDFGEARLLFSCLGWRMGPLPGMSILKISGEKRKDVVRNKTQGWVPWFLGGLKVSPFPF